MNGLELSRGYYEEYGRPMLEEQFPALLPLLAVGLVGSGSERFGFDDDISRDHDFDPGFCIFLPDEATVSRRDAFLLERAYAKLPKEYGGVRRQPVSPVGGSRSGVMRMADFYLQAVGSPDGRLSTEAWLRLPDYALAEATNGEVFYDGFGAFTAIREALLSMPEDVRKKRLAGNLLLMAQAGQYNFPRCLRHGEPEAAELACGEFVSAALKVIFLLEGRYLPYYKWSFRALRGLKDRQPEAETLAFLLHADSRRDAVGMEERIEALSARIAAELRRRGYAGTETDELEALAYDVNGGIADGSVRNLHILAAT